MCTYILVKDGDFKMEFGEASACIKHQAALINSILGLSS